MQILNVRDVLTRAGLRVPTLNVLVSDESNYSVLLFQPQGRIDATRSGIRNREEELARQQFGSFLENARQSKSDLVVTPEYSMPWSVFRDAVNGQNKGPDLGKLWVLGCESIRYSELTKLRDDLAEFATLLFEQIDGDDTKFVDPLAYVFRTSTIGGDETRQIVLVQFKTHAMADKHEFEKNLLQSGSTVYQFGNYGKDISLVSLICSDVFAFTEQIAKDIHDRALIIHIQLNPEPRHDEFLQCRAKLLGFTGDQTEILSLNWASGIEIWVEGKRCEWRNIAGSAWYLKVQDFDSDDKTLAENHRRGLYYTFQPHRTHALFLNFRPGTFALNATKVARIGVKGAVGRRRGPQLNAANSWNDAKGEWKDTPPADDGFARILSECGDARSQIEHMARTCPLACERLLAICGGGMDKGDTWYYPRQLDSFVIDQTEVIFRMTFCQDTSQKASEFRLKRLRRCADLWTILHTTEQLPQSLADLAAGFTLEWIATFPHQNLRSHDGRRATVIYLGEDSSGAQIEQTSKNAREHIRRSFDEDAAEVAKHRVAVWYRRSGNVVLHRRDEYVAIDRTRNESEYDIGRPS